MTSELQNESRTFRPLTNKEKTDGEKSKQRAEKQTY